MLINILVASITVIVLAFVVIWSLVPALRSFIEAPKYAVADWDADRPTTPACSPDT